MFYLAFINYLTQLSVFQKVHSLLYHEPYTDYRVSLFHSKVLFNFHHQVDQLQFHKISLSDLTAIVPHTFFFGPSKELISISKSICLLLFIPSDSRVGQMRQLVSGSRYIGAYLIFNFTRYSHFGSVEFSPDKVQVSTENGSLHCFISPTITPVWIRSSVSYILRRYLILITLCTYQPVKPMT